MKGGDTVGYFKNLQIAQHPTEGEEPDDFLEKAQADEPGIHQPALVKNRNLLPEF